MTRGRAIILVEDSDADRLLYSEYLKQLGYSSFGMDSAEKLLEEIDEMDPGIILMDIEMPGMSGIEAVKILRERQEISGKKHIVIAVSAHKDEYTMNIVAESGFDDYLPKPVTKHEIETVLSRYLKNDPQICFSDSVKCVNGKHDKNKLYSLEMFDADEPEFVRSIVEMFVTNTPGTIHTIRNAFEQDEMEILRQHSHKLRPHFSLFGALTVQQALQMIEDIAFTNQDKEKLPALIEIVETNGILILEQMKADLLS